MARGPVNELTKAPADAPVERRWTCRSDACRTPPRSVLADTKARAQAEYRTMFQLHESRPVEVEPED